jgi:hypothetical protein
VKSRKATLFPMNTKPEPPPTSRFTLLLRFLGGLAYMAILSAVFSEVAETEFLLVFLAVVCGALFSCGLALFWAVGAVLSGTGRPGQFGIRSLLFLTVYVAIYASLVRWLAIHSSNAEDALPIIAFFCLVLMMVSVPVLIFWTESLVWTAVWIVRRNCVQSWLSKRRDRIRRHSPPS